MLIRFFYNVLQHLGIVVLGVPLALFVAATPRYRGRILARLGLGLKGKVAGLVPGKRRIWVHALSVGEVSSVVSLVRGLRNNYPDAQIFLSTSTRSGAQYRSEVLADVVDLFFDFPFDHFWVVRHFVKTLQPNLYVQVETDFWPNLLTTLKVVGVPAILVNGRISAASFRRFQRFAFFFAPLFDCFQVLSMQTAADVEKMVALGIVPVKVCALGNLKIDAALPSYKSQGRQVKAPLPLPIGKSIIVVGSTHPGEEKILSSCFVMLRQEFPGLFLVIAPRNIERSPEIVDLYEGLGFAVVCRSARGAVWEDHDLLIVDTMGELVDFYQGADMVFVGGSLVTFGGHNPLEPAAFGKPVLFGPHMEDFADIVSEMLHEDAARQVKNVDELCLALQNFLVDKASREKAGKRARGFVEDRQGVTARHLKVIAKILRIIEV
ncbi:MAG: 3-deoxy-D-manno-octulosonic acid transferase [Proteobacteria bacterium]|nr:3-deoxy-D-manno-octulosonic acid transferase [Pseudomonadota bacterium]MBU1640207.1 3-deoxy-D-manno-octulosonic acid transferase [Pseudomonadota bacterium]